MVMTSAGDVIAQTQMSDPAYFSICYSDSSISLSDYGAGVFESTNNNFTWQYVFSAPGPWSSRQAIKVITEIKDDNDDDVTKVTWWAIDVQGSVYSRLSIYDVTNSFARSDVILPSDVNVFDSRLAYDDGSQRVFLTDVANNAIHELSAVNGLYMRRLLSASDGIYLPYSITVDVDRRLLYVGQSRAKVTVYELT